MQPLWSNPYSYYDDDDELEEEEGDPLHPYYNGNSSNPCSSTKPCLFVVVPTTTSQNNHNTNHHKTTSTITPTTPRKTTKDGGLSCTLFCCSFLVATPSYFTAAAAASTTTSARGGGERRHVHTNLAQRVWKQVCWDTWCTGSTTIVPSNDSSYLERNPFSFLPPKKKSNNKNDWYNHNDDDDDMSTLSNHSTPSSATSGNDNNSPTKPTETRAVRPPSQIREEEEEGTQASTPDQVASKEQKDAHGATSPLPTKRSPPPTPIATTTTTTTNHKNKRGRPTPNNNNNSQVEQVTGTIVGQYTCVYQGVNGTLYAGRQALYFVGTYFLFDKKVPLPWEMIRQVIKLDQGVRIVTKQSQPQGGGEVHTFSSLQQPSRVWPILVSLHNHALLDHETDASSIASTPTSSASMVTRPLKRRNSDPAGLLAPSMVLMDEDDDEKEEEQTGGASTPRKEEKTRRQSPSVSTRTTLSKKPSKLSTLPVAGLSSPQVREKLGEIKLQPLACTYDGVRGSFYAGWKGLYFYGKRFFWDTRQVYLPFTALKQVQIVSKQEQQGICVTHKNGQTYLFQDMENPDKVWASLLELHNEILLSSKTRGHKHSHGGDASSSLFPRGSFVRMNSDPNLSVLRLNFSQDVETTSGSAVPAPRLVQPQQQEEEKPPQISMQQEWADCVAKKSLYRNLVIENLELECTLDEFMSKFVANGASHSIAKYLESRGDSSLRATNWEEAATESPPQEQPAVATAKPLPQRRVIHYKHPVNAPLAPPQAGARKEQNLTRYGDYGLCLETRTIVDDVPMADCFHVDDRIRVQQRQTNGKSVSVVMEFEITFIKSTMFKSIIEKTTRSEFTDFFKKMGGYMSQAIQGEKAAAVVPAAAAVEPVPVPVLEPVPSFPGRLVGLLRGGGGLSTTLHPLLTVLVLIVQCYILRELTTLKQSAGMMALPPMAVPPSSPLFQPPKEGWDLPPEYMWMCPDGSFPAKVAVVPSSHHHHQDGQESHDPNEQVAATTRI